MDLKHALKEAKTLILEKKIEEASNILNNALNVIQTEPPADLTQEDKLILEAEIQEGIADTKILTQKDQEALSHLLMAMTHLETYESLSQISAHNILFRVYQKLSRAFDRIGQQFESEKYLRKAGEIKGYIFKKDIFKQLSEAGYIVSENVRGVETEASPVDIIGEKGRFRKTRIAIWFAMDESEVDTISYLTKGYAKFAKNRYILLLMGQPTIPNIEGTRIISSIDQIQL